MRTGVTGLGRIGSLRTRTLAGPDAVDSPSFREHRPVRLEEVREA
ncbi:hypothetical protein ACWD3Z_01945 [Streptomyces sp. NPDC002740]